MKLPNHMMITWLLLLVNLKCLDCQEVSKRDPECNSVTGCCTKNAIDSSCQACKTGYHGANCANECPSKCANCTDHPDVETNVSYQGHSYCRYCKEGYYSISDLYQCQKSCQDGCLSCASFMDTNYTCDSCKPGFYLISLTGNYGECRKCPETCRSCSSTYDCVECSLGFFGSYCENACSLGCLDASCNKSTGICTKGCVSDGFLDQKICRTCIDGRYGYDCKHHCPENCFNNICDKANGICFNCTDNTLGPTCSTCIEGWYGSDCKDSCPTTCKSCNKSTNICDECKEGFKGPTCNECVAGRYGPYCNKSCPINCYNSTCDRTSGDCERCDTPFNGSRCETCVDGFYGRNCTFQCSYHCRQRKCYQENGTCISCIDYNYGLYCDQNCSITCQNIECDQETGACVNGCVSGYYGDKCCANFSQCSKCSSDGFCFACKDGMYGDVCDKPCHNCLNSICFKENGTCKTCEAPYQGHLCDIKLGDTLVGSKGQSQVGLIAGSVVGTSIILAVVIIALFLYQRGRSGSMVLVFRKFPCFNSEEKLYKNDNGKARVYENTLCDYTDTDNNPDSFSNNMGSTGNVDAHNGVLDVNHACHYGDSAIDENETNAAETGRQSNPRKVKLEHILDYIGDKTDSFFMSEFEELPKGLQKPCLEARKPDNIIKNRYNAVYPYDDTRVVLSGTGPDFINACYIDGYEKQGQYIASLGPTMRNMDNFIPFWRMVWQERTEKIVMVTNLRENGTMKCEQYWPDVGHSSRYGEIKVTCLHEAIYAEYAIRMFQASKGNDQRLVHHVHFTAWPDKGVPDDVTSLIEFRQKVNAIDTRLNGKIIVHCSAGVGRTGTYIALDILTRQGEAEHAVDVFGCVSNLRQQRTSMVQTWQQYKYLHHAVVHSLTFGCEALTDEEFQEYLSTSSDQVMENKFKQLQKNEETMSLSNDEIDAIARNMAGEGVNRTGSDIPGDRYRVPLYRNGREVYINAVYLNSFKEKAKFLVTQTPIEDTVEDFLAIIIQEEAFCIISLNKTTLGEIYLPDKNQVQTFGAYTVESKKVNRNNNFEHRILMISAISRHQGETTREVHYFRCTHWPDNDPVPESPAQFLHLIRAVEQDDDSTKNMPIVVHCLTGAIKSGLFCAVSTLIQKMEIEKEVSVVNVLKKVKARRALAIPNSDQYKFCYSCVCEYLQGLDKKVYYNV